MYVNYILIERQTGYSLVYIRFFHPASGIWKIFYQGKKSAERKVPYVASCGRLISQDTYFLEPSPYTTVTAPGDARNSITATAYQHRDGSIYIAAGRGYTPDGMITPHLAAPGVNVKSAAGTRRIWNPLRNQYIRCTDRRHRGTLFEWAIYGITSRFLLGAA